MDTLVTSISGHFSYEQSKPQIQDSKSCSRNWSLAKLVSGPLTESEALAFTTPTTDSVITTGPVQYGWISTSWSQVLSTHTVKTKNWTWLSNPKLERRTSHSVWDWLTWYQTSILAQGSFGKSTTTKLVKVATITLSLAGQHCSPTWCLKFIDILTKETNYKKSISSIV